MKNCNFISIQSAYWPSPPTILSVWRWSGLCNWVLCSLSVFCSLFSVCSLYVTFILILYVTFFLILPQYNIRPPDLNCEVYALKFAAGVNLTRHDTLPDLNCDVCAPEFAARVNLRRHDTSTGTAMNVMS